MESNGKYLCYNCFKKRDGQEGPCPYCGFDLEDNAKKYPVALQGRHCFKSPLHRGPGTGAGRIRHHLPGLG